MKIKQAVSYFGSQGLLEMVVLLMQYGASSTVMDVEGKSLTNVIIHVP